MGAYFDDQYFWCFQVEGVVDRCKHLIVYVDSTPVFKMKTELAVCWLFLPAGPLK